MYLLDERGVYCKGAPNELHTYKDMATPPSGEMQQQPKVLLFERTRRSSENAPDFGAINGKINAIDQ